MANSALIEDLRKQFAENPRRVFARLANEYRKSGDLDVAIEICRAHVPLQPTYISGYIVLGQALFERGQPDEARSTFETALSLDPENLIALRQLGDIARASGDIDAARGWYHKLLEVDPQNDDIAAQLEALDVPTQSKTPLSVTTISATPPVAAPVSWSDIHPDSETVTPLSQQAMQPTRPRFTIGVIPENIAADEKPAASATPAPAAKAEARAPEPIVEQNAVSTSLPEFFAGFDRHSPTPPAATPVVPALDDSDELVIERTEVSFDSLSSSAPDLIDISELSPEAVRPATDDLPAITTTAEFSVPGMPVAPVAPTPTPASPPATAAELATLFAGPELEIPSRSETADATADKSESGPTFEEEDYDPTVGRMLDLSHRTSSDALLPDLMMTESGAELLREQGHIDQAIYVYRHLAAKNPGDASYAERIAALERGAHSSIPLIADISQDVISAAKNRPYSTQSIRTFFTSFATRRPPEGAEAEGAESQAPTAEATQQSPEASTPAASVAAQADVASEAPSAPAAAQAPVEPETVSDADRSALETLFTGNPKIAATDERAATALASAFSEEFTPDAGGPAGQPTRAASDALSLDAVFQNTRARADGEPRASQPTVSFDEFFANRENGGASEGKGETAVETASLGDDSQSDLELFHEWLDGLKK